MTLQMLPRLARLVTAVSSPLVFLSPAAAIDPDRDFSGVWFLDEQQSELGSLPSAAPAQLSVSQEGVTIHRTESDKAGNSAVWTYSTDGKVSKYQVEKARMSSQTKWEGAALLINTIVTGPRNYVVTDRWKLSRDHHTLMIRRHIQGGTGGLETEAVLVYRNQAPSHANAVPPAGQPLASGSAPSPAGAAAPQPPAEIVVPAGTKIPLALINSLSTKHSSEGDRVYLQTSFPITVEGRMVIPRGSYGDRHRD